jgi:hypothetical protein
VPRYISLITCKLSEEFCVRITIELHARQTTFCIALVRVEETVANISYYSSS